MRIVLLLLLALLLCPNAVHAQITGGKLIYCRNRTLYAVPITATGELQQGKTPHKITRLPNGTTLDALSVSADGNVIALGTESKYRDIRSTSGDDESFTLWTVDEQAQAQLRRWGHGSQPSFAPSGNRLAYSAFSVLENGYTSTYILDLTTGKKRLLRSGTFSTSWSANGDEIALIDTSKRDFDMNIMVVDAATGKQVRFQQEAFNVYSSLLSPDGRFLAYSPHLSRPKLPGIIADRKTGKLIVLPHEGSPVLDWSVNSRHLLWTRYIISPKNEGASLWEEIWITTADGKHSHKIGAGVTGCFAPDGRHVIYLRTQADSDHEHLGLYVADLQGRQHKLLPSCDENFIVWKPTQHSYSADAHR